MKLIVIDIQKGITDERLYDFNGFIKNVTSIIDAARKNNVEVIYVQHDDGPGTGFSVGDRDFEIADQVTPKENEKIFIKTINSCFGNNDLADYLSGSGEKDLMIVGLQTNFCIDASVKSAFERGYRVIIPEGTNSTFDNDYMDREATYKYYNEMMWPERFASCISVDAAIKMMSRVLRPHHGMCFQFYEGKGYSEDFTDHMGRIIREMESEPSQIIRLKVETDIVCENCPNNEAGECNTADKVKRYDEEVLKACGLAEGDEISFAEFTELVREKIIDGGIRSDICGDCSWDYICRDK